MGVFWLTWHKWIPNPYTLLKINHGHEYFRLCSMLFLHLLKLSFLQLNDSLAKIFINDLIRVFFFISAGVV